MNIDNLLSHPDYQSLSNEDKAAARLGWLEKNVVSKPEFQELPEEDKIAALNGFEQLVKTKTGTNSDSKEPGSSRVPTAIDEWKKDAEFNALPYREKRQVLGNYFDLNMADDEFFTMDYAEQDRIKENYFNTYLGPAPKDFTPSTSADAPESSNQEPSVANEFGKGLVRGVAGIPESVGLGIQYTGQRLKGENRSEEYARNPNQAFARMLQSQRDDVVKTMGQYEKQGIPRDQAFQKAVLNVLQGDFEKRQQIGDNISAFGKTAADYWAKKQEPFAPHESINGKNVWDNPELLTNAAWWASGVGEMLPSLAASVVPAVGAQQATLKIGGRLIASTPQAWAKLGQLATVVGAGTGGLVGGALEGSQTYKQVLEETGDEAQAARAGEMMTAAAGVLNSIGNANFLEALGKNVVSRFGYGFAIEGVTEGAEEPAEVGAKLAAAIIEGKPLPDNVTQQFLDAFKQAATVFPIAGLVGGGAASTRSKAHKAIEETLPAEERNKSAEELLDDQAPAQPDPAQEIRKSLARGEIGTDHVKALRAQVRDNHPMAKELDNILAEVQASNQATQDQPAPSEKPKWLTSMTDDQVMKRVRNLQKSERQTGRLSEKQRQNLTTLNQEMADRGIKSAAESATVFQEAMSSEDQARIKALNEKAATAKAEAVEGLTRETGKSAEESARVMLTEQEIANNRMIREGVPAARKFVQENPEAYQVAQSIHSAPSKESVSIPQTPALPAGQGFQLVENKNQIPPELRPAFQKMRESVEAGDAKNRNAKGHPTGSTYPDWFKTISKRDRKAMQKAGVVPTGGWSRKEFERIIEKAENGEEMTERQEARFEQLLRVAEQVKGTDPDLVADADADAIESQGFEPVMDKMPVGNLKKGDQVLVRTDKGEDVLTHKGYDSQGDAILQDGETIKADPFDQIMIDGIKKNESDQAAEIDAQAHEAATSPRNNLPEPTEAQIKAGNYKKGHVTVNGLDISIENPEGSTRKGVDEDGKKWESTMIGHYGYFARSEGKDGEQIDVFVGHEPSNKVFIVDQVDPGTGRFDEHKIVMNASDEESAKGLYRFNYEPGWQGLGAITEMPIDQFKDWLSKGKQTKPVGDISASGRTQASPPVITIQDVQQAFPKQKVRQSGEGAFTINTGSGHSITLHGVESIDDDEIGLKFSSTNEITARGKRQIAGAYDPKSQTIRIVKGVGDRSTIRHESYHFLESSNLIKPQEVKALNNTILQKTGKKANEEARAKFVEAELKKREFNRHSGPVRQALQRVADWIDSLVNLVKKTSRGVIRNIESGKAFNRRPSPGKPKSSETRYSIKEPIDPSEWAKQFLKDHLENDQQAKESVEKLKEAGKSDTVIHDEAKGLFGYVKERFGKGFVDDDMKWYDRAFGLPYWLGKKYESMNAAVDIEINAAEIRAKELFNDYDGELGRIQESIPKNKKRMQELRDLIWKWDGQRFPKKAVPSDWYREIEDSGEIEINTDHYEEVRAFLKEDGVSKPVIDAFMTIRQKLDEKWIDAERTLRGENLDQTTIEEYRSMIKKTHNYFPHRRTGNAHVSIINKDTGDVVYREHYNTAKDRILPINKKAKARAGTWLKEAIEKGNVTEKNRSAYEIKIGPVKKLPDEAFFQIPAEAMQLLVTEAGKRLENARVGYEAERLYNRQGKTKKEAIELARKRMRADMDAALSKAVAEVFQSRGWASHAIGRKGTPGHETDDIFGILFDYLSGYAGFKTKISRAMAHHDNLMKVDPKQHPNEYRHLSKYVKDMLANQDRVDKSVDSLRGLFFVKYLGFVVKSGMVNLTQNVVMAAPVLSIHTKGGILKAERILGKAMFDVRKALTSKAAWTGKKIDYATLSKDEQQALHELVESGASMDLFLKELKGNMPGSGWTKHFKKVVDKAGIFMGVAEKFNRASTGLAAYRLALKEKGMQHDQAVDFAKQVIYDSHFIYGKVNLPTAFRGGDFQKVARAAYTFRSFTHNYVSAMVHLLTNSGWSGKRAFARSLRNLFVVGGLTAIPFFKALSEALLWSMGDDDEDAMTIVRESLPNEWLRDLAVYGLPGVAGVDLTGSLSIEVPRSWKDLAGVPYAMIEDTVNAVESLKSGAHYRVLSETPFTPIAVRNAMRGIELYALGQHTRSGKAINYHGAKGPRKISASEAVLKSLVGLQPVSSSKSYGAYQATQKMQDALQEKKSKWASRYVNAMIRMDAETMEKVKAEVTEWNVKARKEGKPHKIINIRQAVAYRLKPSSKYLPKTLRKEATKIAEAWGKEDS
ncbi:uncharacterized protein Dvar_53780 [Desulfosarcina variabilis str. Montpellier]|uniref:PLxRFG domain-containing protein n=1 Tax=Desulfosarcina variabilis TaxID=2300 RepID=UPI003AFB5429